MDSGHREEDYESLTRQHQDRIEDRLRTLKKAGKALYMATTWHSEDLADEVEKELWEDFRDALGLEQGIATRNGVDG